MDPNTVTATRIYKEQEKGKLGFERFPHMGLLKVRTTYIPSKQKLRVLNFFTDMSAIIIKCQWF